MKKFFLALIAMVMLLACGGQKEEKKEGGAAPESKKIKIGVTIYKYDDNFMATVRKDLETFAKEKGNVELIMNDSQNSQATQNEQVDALLSKGVNVLAINLVDPAASQTIIDKAKAADVPFIYRISCNSGTFKTSYKNSAYALSLPHVGIFPVIVFSIFPS